MDATGSQPGEPTVLVFYLGQTCMACVTHLVELDVAISRVRDRGARVLAISADSPEFSRRRLDRFGDLRIPLFSDTDHATALAYAVWNRFQAPTRARAGRCTARSSSTGAA